MHIKEFLQKLSSREPVPGGGSAAALVGAIGAAQLSMAAKLSMKEHPQAKTVSEKCEKLMMTCLDLADEDERAFAKVMKAYKLPKKTTKEQSIRSKRIEESLKRAADVPLRSARVCLEVIQLADDLLPRTSPNVLSDLGVASLAAQAASEGAILNVLINAMGMKDKPYAQNLSKTAELVVEDGKNRTSRIIREITEALKGF